MKVSKWKVLSIAGALVLGYVVSSDAAQIKVSDETFADLGYWMKVRYVNFDERAKNEEAGIDYRTNVFDVVDARFNIEGQINKIVQFYGEVVTSGAYDGGAVLHGEIAKGMFRYDLGIFNQASDKKPLQSVAWGARIEFTPTMLGFTPETKTTGRGWLHDTYLGKKGDVLTIGLSYFNQDVEVTDVSGTESETGLGTGVVVGGALLLDPAYLVGEYTYEKELDVDGYNVDIFLEKKLGSAILNLEGAYTYFNDSHLVMKGDVPKKKDSYYWYIQGQIMHDCVVGIGKPALYAKYEYLKADGAEKDWKMNRWGVGVNYYIVGNAARLTVGLDNVNYDGAASKSLKDKDLKDNITDYYVQAQIMF